MVGSLGHLPLSVAAIRPLVETSTIVAGENVYTAVYNGNTLSH